MWKCTGGIIMNKGLWIIVTLLILSIIHVHGSIAQQSEPVQTAPVDTTLYDIDKRLEDVEDVVNELNQRHNILLEDSEKRNEQLQTLLQYLGVGFVLLTVIFGGIAAWAGWRQSRQQGNLISAHVRSAGQVSDVLGVVHNMLENRFLRFEKEQKEISELKTQVESFTKVINRLEKGIESQRQRLESTAETLALTSRHDFKKPAKIQLLNEFAGNFDNFQMQYQEEEFSSQCMYILGIAAAFDNKFKNIRNYLNQVVNVERERAEIDDASRKRLANAYYYLGINHSNLGELDDAVRFLEKAQELDQVCTDVLTPLVMAEVYVMSGQYEKAKELLHNVEGRLDILKDKQGRLLNHQRRLHSRAYLIRSNIAFIEKGPDWEEHTKQNAEAACRYDPSYYYALSSRGQIIKHLGKGTEISDAEKLFVEAYSMIQETGDLHFVKEIRTRILLLMVAAICCKHGNNRDEQTVSDYLDEARLLRNDLPKIDDRRCTVFSPLNKQNVDFETIGSHIEEIRKGTVLL